MNIVLKILLTLVCCIGSFITVKIFSNVFFAYNQHSRLIVYSISIPLSLLIGVVVWRKPIDHPAIRFAFILMGGFVIGAVGFAVSFYGILLYNIGGNMGPLISIFFIGPISFIIGLLVGKRYWESKLKSKRFIQGENKDMTP
ncbi:MAG: hypothetical protein ABIT07_01280 [Ferruginibacter sp.]